MFSPGKRNANCDKIKVVANSMIVIILQHIMHKIKILYALNYTMLHVHCISKKLGDKSICFHNDIANQYQYTSCNF